MRHALSVALRILDILKRLVNSSSGDCTPTRTLTGLCSAPSFELQLQFNPLARLSFSVITIMATTNVGRFLEERYYAAIAKYKTDRLADALDELSDLLMDDQLPLVLRLKANCALADGVSDWFLAESYYSAAEMIHDVIRTSFDFLPGSQEEIELARLRKMLDSLAADQRRMDPRQLQKSDVAQQSNTHQDTVNPETTAEPTDQAATVLQGPQTLERPSVGSAPQGLPRSAAMANFEVPSEESPDAPAAPPSLPDPTVN